jgi:predicted transcriptional regulator
MSTTMTIRLDDELKEQLDRLAAATQRSKSFLASEAIREFIELNEWQVQEIQQALKEADAGEFASDGEVKQTFAKWGVDAG